MQDARSLIFPDGRSGFDGMVFDFDGTLADSMAVWKQVDVEFLAKRSLPIPPGYHRTLSTMNFESCARYVIETFALEETAEDIMDEWNAMALGAYSGLVRFKPDVRKYLEKVRALGVRTSIATTLTGELLQTALDANEAWDLFDAVASSDDTPLDKHDPTLYLLAASRMDIPPHRCVVYEDIVPGVLSARSAGMATVGVRDDSGHQEREKLREAADAFIDGFRELL